MAGINLLENHEALSVDFDKKILIAKDLKENKELNFSYDQLVIATGAQPLIPDIKGIDSDNVYSITRPQPVKKLKEKLSDYKTIAVVGGGFIGVEMADQLASYPDLEVKLYHSRDQLLNRVYDRDAGQAIGEEIKRLGAQIHYQERLRDLKTEDNLVKEIITTNRKDPVDALVLALGFRPNTAIFTDKRLEKLRNGAIIIDKYGRTSIPQVWAVGDCASVPHKFLGDVHIPLGTSANKLGRQIAINLFRKEEDYQGDYESLGSSLVKVGQLEFGTTGLTEDQAKELGLDYGLALSKIRNKPGYMPDSSPIDFRIIYEKESFKILGARVFGKEDAVLRLMSFTTAIHAGLTTKQLAYYDFAYSPPFNSTWDAVNIAASLAK